LFKTNNILIMAEKADDKKVNLEGIVIDGFTVKKTVYPKGSKYTAKDKNSYDYLVKTNKIK